MIIALTSAYVCGSLFAGALAHSAKSEHDQPYGLNIATAMVVFVAVAWPLIVLASIFIGAAILMAGLSAAICGLAIFAYKKVAVFVSTQEVV